MRRLTADTGLTVALLCAAHLGVLTLVASEASIDLTEREAVGNDIQVFPQTSR